MPRIHEKSMFIASLVAILPAAVFGVVTLVYAIPIFFNHCVSFGSYGETTIVTPVSVALGGCSSFTRISETVPQAVMGLVLIQGSVLVAAILGIAGIVYSRRVLLLPAFGILIAESILLLIDGLFVLTLPASIFFLWAAIRSGRRWQANPKEREKRRVVVENYHKQSRRRLISRVHIFSASPKRRTSRGIPNHENYLDDPGKRKDGSA